MVPQNVIVTSTNTANRYGKYHDTGHLRIKPDDVAEPLYAFTVPRESDFSVVRLN